MPEKPRLKGAGADWTGPDDPRIPVRRKDEATRRLWWDEFVARFTVVGQCSFCNRDLIAEEVKAHRHVHVDGRLRPYTRQIERLSREDRVTLLNTFCAKCGALDQAEPHIGH